MATAETIQHCTDRVYYMPVEDISDEVLAESVQDGDQEAFGVLVERYEAKLLRYGKKFLSQDEDIEDIVQDVFLSTYRNIRGFDVTQRFSPWIYRIAHNAFVNSLRSKDRTVSLPDIDTVFPHLSYEDPAETERETQDMRVLLEKGLSGVSPKYREVLVLHYFEDMQYRDIADVLQVPVGTVGIRLKRAKEALRVACNNVNNSYGT